MVAAHPIEIAVALVQFTRNLQRFFPSLGDVELGGETVAAVVAGLDGPFPGLVAYVVDERGALRRHVNIFVDGEMVRDRVGLSDAVGPDTRVFVVQALSGG